MLDNEKKQFCLNLNNSVKKIFLWMNLCGIVLSLILVLTIHLAFIWLSLTKSRMPEHIQNLMGDLQNLLVLEVFLVIKYFINYFYFI